MPPNDRPVLIADGEQRSRALISSLLKRAGYATREVKGGEEALDAARRERPCLAILDPSLPDICGYEVCRTLKEEFGESLPIVFVSADRTESFDRVGGLLLGADDYVVKPFAPDELLARVRRLIHGAPSSSKAKPMLTRREQEVLGLLAEGLRQKQIASRLFISERTVGTHIEHILAKLGVRSRAQAVALAYRQDLLGVSD